MSTLILEHVPITELPAAWRAQLHGSGFSRVTVRIEEEPQADEASLTQNRKMKQNIIAAAGLRDEAVSLEPIKPFDNAVYVNDFSRLHQVAGFGMRVHQHSCTKPPRH